MGQSHLAIPKKSREDFSTKIRVESLPFKSQENSVTVWKKKEKKNNSVYLYNAYLHFK